MPVAKHFPGHGGITQDSHFTTPKKMSTYEELATHDLVPFAVFAKQDFAKAIMTAHVALPNIDPSGLPATYSQVIIRDYLRGKLRYDGLIMTDDLEMNGASGDDIGERAVKAFLAGNDMLMLAGSPADQAKAFRAMVAAVKDGRIGIDRLNQSVNRIFAAKKSLKIDHYRFDPPAARLAIRKQEAYSSQILRENFTIAAARASLPEIPRSVLVLSSDRRFYKGFKKGFKGKSGFFRLGPKSLNAASEAIADPKYEYAVFYASGAKTARWLKKLSPEVRRKTIVINANHAGEVARQSTFQSVLNINSQSPKSGEWLGKVLETPSISTVSKPPRTNPGAG
jgi:beta-N-acetylhexosaminidase